MEMVVDPKVKGLEQEGEKVIVNPKLLERDLVMVAVMAEETETIVNGVYIPPSNLFLWNE